MVGIADVVANVTDNDVAGFLVTPTAGLTTTEAGGSDTFTVALTSQPEFDVTIDVSSNTTAAVTVTWTPPLTLTFTSSNWNTAQTVTVTGQDDAAADGDIAYTIALDPASSADAAYNLLDPPDVDVVNIDDDSPAVLITASGGSPIVNDGGAGDERGVTAGRRGGAEAACWGEWTRRHRVQAGGGEVGGKRGAVAATC